MRPVQDNGPPSNEFPFIFSLKPMFWISHGELIDSCGLQSKHLVVFTGAGISTYSGILDFRGPKGIWTSVGVRKARKISGTFSVPIIGVHPMEAHALVARLNKQELQFPFMVLLISSEATEAALGNSKDYSLK